MQIRWNFLQTQIVLLVAVSAANVINMLAFRLLRRQLRRRAATNYATDDDRSQNFDTGFPMLQCFNRLESEPI